MLSKMYSVEGIAGDMDKGQSFAFIDNKDGRIGYLSWSYPAPGELFIHKFYIENSLQGQGIGRQAFAALLEQNPGVKTVRLTVNRKNYKSINFYYRVGFTIEEVKDFDIGNGYFMNDFIMKYVSR
jgi:RimJ/RimL family protein N-acetyltransferase